MKIYPDFVIGAIGSGPIFLAYAGLMTGKRFINSVFEELNINLSFIGNNNRILRPVVEDGNIITADGGAARKFAVTLARKIGIECPNNAAVDIEDDYREEDLVFHYPEGVFEEVKQYYSFLFEL